MASKFELQNPLFTSVTRTIDDIRTDVTKEVATPDVAGVVNGLYDYNAVSDTPPATITSYKFSPPSVAKFQEYYSDPRPETLEAGCRFIVANRFNPTQHNLNVEVSFKEEDGYVTTDYFTVDANNKKLRVIEPETQVEFAITFRDDGTGTIKGYACAYPPVSLPRL